ncbi:hypothetical protein NDU88_000635 [Pleurodeles waltl]|uniref:Uncharacterized protein n=1 Tax=Pleurodeles waltl TaxID=8319 RepID=A0AAV7KQR9_PLEWA|nr:hypothetical protein NDU88_000635 [Pleurodeles waltl]
MGCPRVAMRTEPSPLPPGTKICGYQFWFTACNRAITATDTSHIPKPAEKCPGGTIWGTAHPEVLPDPDIRVEDAETLEEGETEKREGLEPEEEKGAEPEEKGREELEERRENPTKWRSLEGDPETPTETDERHDQSRHVPGRAWLAQVRSCLQVNFLPRWNRSERGTQGRDREEEIGKETFDSVYTYL